MADSVIYYADLIGEDDTFDDIFENIEEFHKRKKINCVFSTNPMILKSSGHELSILELKFPKNVDDSCACWVHILLVRAWENRALVWFQMTY